MYAMVKAIIYLGVSKRMESRKPIGIGALHSQTNPYLSLPPICINLLANQNLPKMECHAFFSSHVNYTSKTEH
jgi:hypothetical protein